MASQPQLGRIEPAMLPSFSRYWRMFVSGERMSITRALQYEALQQFGVEGSVLDVGGGIRAGYRKLIKSTSYDAINIDPALEPTWVVRVGERFPCPADKYDVVLSMNTFEHVFDAQFIAGEMFRALLTGGRFVCAVPFLYPIHGAPDDFFRPAPSWYFHALSSVGFSDIVVRPLVWGPFSTGYICSTAPGPFKNARRHLALLSDLFYVAGGQRFRTQDLIKDGLMISASAFFVTARK